MHFDLFHQILLWPLEISEKPTPRNNPPDLDRWVGILESGGLWQEIPDPYDRGTAASEAARYAEFVYFHPFVQDFLYPADASVAALRILCRTGVGKVRVRLRKVEYEESLDVVRVHLYLFRTHVAILVVELQGNRRFERDTLLDFQDQFRRVYAPYWEESAGHCPSSVQWCDRFGADIGEPSNFDDRAHHLTSVGDRHWRRPPVAKHWEWLLRPLHPSEPLHLRRDGILYFDQIEDERIPCMSYLAIEDPTAISRGDFVRLAFLDGSGNPAALPYAKGFVDKYFESDYCYDRFWDPATPGHEWMNTRYLCCGYSFTVVGSSRSSFYVDGDSGILFHFRNHYFQLGLIAQFHRASLLRFSDRLNEASKKLDNQAARKHIGELRRELADFVTGYWFREVSNQLQGREIFELWSNRLGTPALFEQVMNETRTVGEVLSAEYNEGLTKEVNWLTRWLVPIALLTLVAAVLALDPVKSYVKDGALLFAIWIASVVAAAYFLFPRPR